MNNLNALLRDGDPVRREPGLSPDAVADLRRAMLAAAHAEPVRPVFWGRQLTMAACLTVMVLTGLVAAYRAQPAERAIPPVTSDGSGERTQIHFATPGGTRVVWTLDPGFQLRETLK